MTLTLLSPQMPDPLAVPVLRWGVVGTGIAASFVRAITSHTPQRVVAVTARDQARTQAFAAEHGIATAHPGSDALVADPEVDAVYVATPHPNHRDVALAAIAHGKHVLVEKPIAMTAAEAEEITRTARAAGLLAMEAMWTRYLPQHVLLRQLIADGVLGDVHLVTADFGFIAPFDPSSRLWDPALGGGALLDAGVYPISFASSVIGPIVLTQAAGAMVNGVDARASLQLTAATGAVAQVATSLQTALPVEAQVMGSLGRARLLSPFLGPSGLEVTVGGWGAAESAVWRDERFTVLHDGMSDEATAFAQYVGEGRTESPVHGHDDVVRVMAIIDDARAQVGAGSAVPT